MPTADEHNPVPPEFPKTNFFSRAPVSGADIKPAAVVPDGTDLHKFTDSIVASQAANAAESKKNLEKFIADEYQIQCNIARAEIADAKEKASKKAFHDGVAKRQEEALARRQAVEKEREAKKAAARQLELKAKLSTLIAAVADAGLIVEEIKDKKCIQIKLLHEAASQLCHSIKWDEAQSTQ